MKTLLISAAFFAAASPALSATVLEYTSASSVNNTTLAPSSVGAGVTGQDMTAGPGINPRAGTTWVWNNWTDGGVVNTSQQTASASGHTWTWGFTSTQAFDLTAFDIRLDRSGLGPNEFAIGFSTGGAFTTVLSDNFGDGSEGINYRAVDMSAFSGVTSGTFVLAAWGADSGGSDGRGTFDLENLNPEGYGFQLRGDVATPAPVPLPAALPMLLAGLGGLGLMGRRKT